jgi:hypothetical protein
MASSDLGFYYAITNMALTGRVYYKWRWKGWLYVRR